LERLDHGVLVERLGAVLAVADAAALAQLGKERRAPVLRCVLPDVREQRLLGGVRQRREKKASAFALA